MLFKEIAPSELKNAANLLQTAYWAEVKSNFGWKARAFEFNKERVLLLCRELPFFGGLAYAPFGPGQEIAPDFFSKFAAGLARALAKNTFLIQFDLPWEFSRKPELNLNGLKKAAADIQVPTTVVADISKSEDDILAAMKSKTRYNIRLSAKKEVIIRQCGAEELDRWYEMYKITAIRDRISIHSFAYYKAVFSIAEKYDDIQIRLYLAEHEDDLLAGIIVVFYGDRATYLYGASSDKKRNLMPAYGLQWKAILDAKALGCKEYDFFGIPDSGDESDQMNGLYRFKTGFGGEIVYRPGCWDFPVMKLKYSLFCLGMKLRTYYYKSWKKNK